MGGEKTAASSKIGWDSKGRSDKGRGQCGKDGGHADGSGHDCGANRIPDKSLGTPRVSGEGVTSTLSANDTRWEENSTMGVDAVVMELSRRATVPGRRAAAASFYFAFDHCFSVRGQGTILTGTVLAGEVKVSFGSVIRGLFCLRYCCISYCCSIVLVRTGDTYVLGPFWPYLEQSPSCDWHSESRIAKCRVCPR